MKLIDNNLLDSVTARAKESPRLRMNYNFHDRLDAPSQRLINAVEPGTVMAVHRHMHTSETYFVLRGKVKVKIYNDKKEIIQEVVLDPKAGNYGGHIPIGEWHTIEVLETGSVIFECKDGPFIPITPDNILQ